QVAVGRVRLLGRGRHGDVVLLGVGDEVAAAFELPLAPGRDDAYVGFERVIGQLEAHLVVALARRAVRHGVRALAPRDLYLPLRDDGARERGAEQADALVDRVRLHRRPHVLLDEL